MFSLALIIPVLIIVAIVYLVWRPRSGQSGAGSAYRALMGYFYLMIAASLITVTVGVIIFAQVGIGQAFNGGEIKNDITIASVLVGTGFIIGMLHLLGKRTLQKRDNEATANIRRVYLFFMLGIYGIAGVVSLPLAIYQTVRYYTVEHERPYYYHAPSAEIAVAAVVVALWGYFMFRVMRDMRQRHTAQTPDLPPAQQ